MWNSNKLYFVMTQTPHETDSMNQGTVSSLKSQEQVIGSSSFFLFVKGSEVKNTEFLEPLFIFSCQKNKPSAEECSTSSDNVDDSSIERYVRFSFPFFFFFLFSQRSGSTATSLATERYHDIDH